MEASPDHQQVTRLLQQWSGGDKQALDELINTRASEMAYQIAAIYAWRGDKDQAFAWLDRAFAQHDGGLIYLKLDTPMASLRTDPRYRVLRRKMNLPE